MSEDTDKKFFNDSRITGFLISGMGVMIMWVFSMFQNGIVEDRVAQAKVDARQDAEISSNSDNLKTMDKQLSIANARLQTSLDAIIEKLKSIETDVKGP